MYNHTVVDNPEMGNAVSLIPESSSKKKLVFKIALLCIVLAVGVVYFLMGNKKINNAETKQASEIKTEAITPTPFAFEEMTVPYLRNRSYSSSLGNLEQISDNGNYTSYLTSYTSDGLKINGLLTKPDARVPSEGFPAIVFIHGYIPPREYQTLEKYVNYVDFLARSGFVVFKIDLRGHGNSEGKPGGGYYSSDYVIDALNAYSALQNTDFVSKNKIGLWGHSMAGNIVLRTLAAKPEIPAAVIWAGAGYTYEDLQKYRISDASYQPLPNDSERQRKRRELFEKYGSPSASSKFWQQVAPTNYLNDLKGAIELNHAEDDTVVNIGYSRDLNALLDKTKVPHEFYEYPSGGHNINDGNFNLAMQRTVDFFKKYLK